MLTPAFRGSYLNRLFFVVVFYCGMLTGFSAEHCTINQNDVVSENYRVATLTDLPEFTKKFNSLVSRAYFKLIVEDERADIRLVNEYKRLYAKNEDKMDDLVFQKERKRFGSFICSNGFIRCLGACIYLDDCVRPVE